MSLKILSPLLFQMVICNRLCSVFSQKLAAFEHDVHETSPYSFDNVPTAQEILRNLML